LVNILAFNYESRTDQRWLVLKVMIHQGYCRAPYSERSRRGLEFSQVEGPGIIRGRPGLH
jgi:hypothetical protein